MRRWIPFIVLGVLGSAALTSGAWADSPPPPPPPGFLDEVPPADAVTVPPSGYYGVAARAEDPPAPPPEPPAPPSGDEVRGATEGGPPAVVETMPPPPSYAPPSMPCAPPPAPCAPPCPPRDPCCFQWRDSCGWPIDPWCCLPYGRFELTVEATWSYLGSPQGPFGENSGFPNQLFWDTLDYDGEFGVRGAVSYAVAPQERIEARFAWIGSFDDSERQAGVFGFSPASPAPPIIPGTVPGVTATNAADFHSEADLYTGELNYWTELMCKGHHRVDFVIGARYIQFDETARADNWAPFSLLFPADPFVEADVENTYFAIQSGVALHHDFSDCFTAHAGFKGMLGYLMRDVAVSDRSIFSGGNHNAANDDEVLAFGLEAEFGVKWRLTNVLAITGGYSLLFLDEVVRAQHAMDFGVSQSGAVQATQEKTDQLFAHSFFLGLNLNL